MSQHTARKSENMISAIGRKPVIAAPMAAPSIACSEIGQSRTRFGPNFSSKPAVALNTPPAARHVFAQENDVLVARHFLRDAGRDGVAIGQFRHAAPPSAHTFFSMTSSEGSGDALAVSVASSTFLIASASMSFSVASVKPSSSRRAR